MGIGGEQFNNLYKDCNVEQQFQIDFVVYVVLMGVNVMKVISIVDLEVKLVVVKGLDILIVIVIDIDLMYGLIEIGQGSGVWWDVGIFVVGINYKMVLVYENYLKNMQCQNFVN